MYHAKVWERTFFRRTFHTLYIVMKEKFRKDIFDQL